MPGKRWPPPPSRSPTFPGQRDIGFLSFPLVHWPTPYPKRIFLCIIASVPELNQLYVEAIFAPRVSSSPYILASQRNADLTHCTAAAGPSHFLKYSPILMNKSPLSDGKLYIFHTGLTQKPHIPNGQLKKGCASR